MKSFLFLWFAPAVVFLPAVAQVEVSQYEMSLADQAFYIDALSFADRQSSRSRIDVYVHVGYDLLSFVKKGELYDASYEMTVSVSDTNGALVNEKLWTEEIEGITFDESVSPNGYRLSQRALTVAPGRYKVSAHMRDLDSKRTRSLVRKVVVPDFGSPAFSMSDIMLVSRISEKGGKRSILPNITENVGNLPDAFYVFFEAYDKSDTDTVRFVVDILDAKREMVLSFDTLDVLTPDRTDVLIRVPSSSLPLGDYSIFVRAFPDDSAAIKSDERLGTTSRFFVVRWEGLPKAMKDIDVAIQQLRYIAKDNELKPLEEAQTPEQKQQAFLDFWKKRDPNPNTPRNERMEEYYRRVAYANKKFGHYLEGWRTDMGMVYIMFGPPNDVSRHPFEVDSKPYEVWRYYDINYEFVFVDQSGFGDYRLLTPIWEAWQRAGRQTGW